MKINLIPYITIIIFITKGLTMTTQNDFFMPNGTEMFVTLQSGHKIWTKRSAHGSIPLLLLHGGPGGSHEGFANYEENLAPHGYQIIVYDQLDSYKSDKPNDPSLWTIERFCREVEEVRQALGLNHFYLLGHSWGGMLAIEYALAYPNNLKGLIIKDMTASTAASDAFHLELRNKFPQAIQDALASYETANDLDNPAYNDLVKTYFYGPRACRLNPVPQVFLTARQHFNSTISDYLLGKNKFVCKGKFNGWDRWNDLPLITIPTLVIGGENDFFNPEDFKKMAALMPKGQASIIPNAGHTPHYENPEVFFRTLQAFLDSTQLLTQAAK